MACESIQELVNKLEQAGELERIRTEIDPDLGLSAVTSEVCRKNGPALLYENTRGGAMPVLANAFGSLNRAGMALGISDFDSVAVRVKNFIDQYDRASLRHENLLNPDSTVPATPPCHEVILENDEVDLTRLPVPRCWPLDAGPAITLPVVFTMDRQTGNRNAGMYRLQVFDRNATGMHWYPGTGGARHYAMAEAMGKPLPVAVAIGTPPAVTFAACAPLPRTIYEIDFAEMLAGSRIEMIRCLHSDLEVPAMSQIVLEGIVYPGERKTEGPFGTHTGYYSRPAPFPVLHVTCMTMRKHPLYSTTVPGPPPQEDCFMAKVIERLFMPLVKKKFPCITDINAPLEGIFNRLIFIAIQKEHPGQGAEIIRSIGASTRGIANKMIWIFDSDVNIHNIHEVLWRMSNNTDPVRDLTVWKGMTDSLDAAAVSVEHGSRLGLDCTRKWPEELNGTPWPEDMIMNSETRAEAEKLLKSLEFTATGG